MMLVDCAWDPSFPLESTDQKNPRAHKNRIGTPPPPPKTQERQGVPAREGDPARGIPTPKPPTARENHAPGPPLEPGPLAPCPFPNRCGGGGLGREGGSRLEGGVRVPGSWCSSACTGSRSVGLPRAGSPQRAGTPRISPKTQNTPPIKRGILWTWVFPAQRAHFSRCP